MRCKIRLKTGDWVCNKCAGVNIRRNNEGLNQPFCCKNKIFLTYKNGYYTNIKEICKCGDKKCIGFILIHPNELKGLHHRKDLIRRENGNVEFELMDSPSSGEIFTKFYELHVRRCNMKLCRHCKWSEACICVVCEEGTTLVCKLKHKHVEKDDPGCDIFEEDKNHIEKGYYKRNE